MTYASEVLADSPVVYYRLGEAAGTTMVDASANGTDGTYVNTPTLGASGAIADGDTAVTFTRAQSEYATMPNTNLPSGASAYTLEMWVKPTVFDNAQSIISIGSSGTIDAANAMRLNSDGTVRNYWWGNDLDAPGTGMAVNVWAHLAATFDGTTRRIYVNGVETGSDTPGTPNVTQTTATIGRTMHPTAGASYFNGGIDEAAVYDYALSAARILAHYDAAFEVPDGLTLAGSLPALTESITLRSYTRTLTDNQAGGILIRGASIEPTNAPDVEPVPATVSEAEMRDKAVAYTRPAMVSGRIVDGIDPSVSLFPSTSLFPEGS